MWKTVLKVVGILVLVYVEFLISVGWMGIMASYGAFDASLGDHTPVLILLILPIIFILLDIFLIYRIFRKKK